MKYLILFSSLIPTMSISQMTISAVICNGKHEPLALTNVVLLNDPNGSITNESGQFKLSNVGAGDTLRITNVAYQPLEIAVSKIKVNDTILLSESIKQLSEIVISRPGKYKSKVQLGFFNYTNNGEFKLGPGNEIALYIENTLDRPAIIVGIYFRLKQLGKCRNNLRVRLLSLDTLSSRPLLDILNENITILNSELKTRNYIDLSKEQIKMPRSGIFVVLELLYPETDC